MVFLKGAFNTIYHEIDKRTNTSYFSKIFSINGCIIWGVCSFIHSFIFYSPMDTYLLSIFYVPSTVLTVGKTKLKCLNGYCPTFKELKVYEMVYFNGSCVCT